MTEPTGVGAARGTRVPPRGSLPAAIQVVEVGPRDGLQAEAGMVPTPAKVAFIEALAAAGLPTVEATSFVHPRAVPQLADADAVMRQLRRRSGVRYPVLVPNERGLDRALDAGADALALFTAAAEAFSAANVQATIAETFRRFAPVASRARAHQLWLRGYVSVAVACPYSGPVSPAAAVDVAVALLDLGCDEVALADTIGAATPVDVARLLEEAAKRLPVDRLALHLHDTHGRAIDNVFAALEYGVMIFDSAAGGLGGCPFAPGSPGNLATETLVAACERAGIATNVDREAVSRAVATARQAMVLAESSSQGDRG